MVTNPKIHKPHEFKQSFGKDIYDAQRKAANFKDGSLKRTVRKKGQI